MFRRLVVPLTVLIALAVPLQAKAEPITIAFTATVYDLWEQDSAISSFGVGIGTDVFGELTWDTNSFLSMDATRNFVYYTPSAPVDVRVEAGQSSLAAHWDYLERRSDGTLGFATDLGVLQPYTSPYVEWAFLTSLGSVPSLYNFLQHPDATILTGGTLRVGDDETGFPHYTYNATITEAHQVPEPPSWMLLGLGGIGWLVIARRGRLRPRPLR